MFGDCGDQDSFCNAWVMLARQNARDRYARIFEDPKLRGRRTSRPQFSIGTNASRRRSIPSIRALVIHEVLREEG